MVDLQQLIVQLEKYNLAYRSGQPLVDDVTYDQLVEQLRRLDPQHPFLHTIEPEKFSGRSEVRHPVPMLSTEKAYTDLQLERFVARVHKEALLLGIAPVVFRMTPKLDGLAGRDDGKVFASRGNGQVGYDISSVFAKGIVAVGGRGQGLGEIVVQKSYFDLYLGDKFEHPRNMVVGIVSSDTLNDDVRQALQDGVVQFVPYAQLPAWEGDGDLLVRDFAAISEQLQAQADYPLDGVVIEAIDERLKVQMGATAHHYRWQIAVKRKGETAETVVEGIQWQVGRTGAITPVLEVAPVALSGATIRRVTAHHAGMITKLAIGPGARIEVIRSGEVIPKLERVLKPAAQVQWPDACPACGQPLIWEGDFLKCPGLTCPAQTERRISHWFRTLGNADWFGIKTIQRLVAGGYDSLEKIYAMRLQDFESLGFGPIQSKNLVEALAISRSKPVEDWRFLAALGISHLGAGDSRKLLAQIPLEKLLTLGQEQIASIKGFGDEKSKSIVSGLMGLRDTFLHLTDLGFQLLRTEPIAGRSQNDTPISGKHLVFTGKMQQGSREAMEAQARRLGAVVQSAVSSTTEYLICGDKVGQTKLDKASTLGVRVLSEQAYYQLIGPPNS